MLFLHVCIKKRWKHMVTHTKTLYSHMNKIIHNYILTQKLQNAFSYAQFIKDAHVPSTKSVHKSSPKLQLQ